MHRSAIALGAAAIIVVVPGTASAAPAIPPVSPSQVVAASEPCPDVRLAFAESVQAAQSARRNSFRDARKDFLAARESAVAAKKRDLRGAADADERISVLAEFRRSMAQARAVRQQAKREARQQERAERREARQEYLQARRECRRA